MPPALRWLAAALASAGLAATAAADEPWIAVIAEAGQQASIDSAALARIYRRRTQVDGDGHRYIPVNLPADQPLRRRFSRAVLGVEPEALDAYWNQQYFLGVTPPHVLGSEAAVSRFVAATPGAIGYRGACPDDSAVRVILLIDPAGALHPPGAAPACPPP